jgi:hypothetical protein
MDSEKVKENYLLKLVKLLYLVNIIQKNSLKLKKMELPLDKADKLVKRVVILIMDD